MDNSVGFFTFVCFFIFFTSIIAFSYVFTNNKVSKSKYSKLHNWSTVSLVFGVAVMIAIGFSFIIYRDNRVSSDTSTVADGFTIEQ